MYSLLTSLSSFECSRDMIRLKKPGMKPVYRVLDLSTNFSLFFGQLPKLYCSTEQ